jgi:peptide/nickel transport system ATP-binding protein
MAAIVAGNPATGRTEDDGRALLTVSGLSVAARSEGRQLMLVQDVDFEVLPGETVGLMGESGCGKSVTANSIVGLLPAELRIAGGQVTFDGRDVTRLSSSELRGIRGGQIGMIFQDPQNSLNPAFTVGNQLTEAIQAHRPMSGGDARREAISLLEHVGIARAADRLDSYPHQFSGGMAQRVMIAIAISCRPKLLIADEPTTALDVTVQAQILDLLRTLQAETGMGLVIISHDLSVIAEMTDRVAIMYAGQVVERGATAEVFGRPRHPYTEALLGAHPRSSAPGQPLRTIPGSVPAAGEMPAGCRFHTRCEYAEERCGRQPPEFISLGADGGVRCLRHAELTLEPVRKSVDAQPAESSTAASGSVLVSASRLTKSFATRRALFGRATAAVLAVDNVTFRIHTGETFGLVGESGAGKSTVGRLLLGLAEPTSGSIAFEGVALTAGGGKGYRAVRKDIQAVFQNPYASLDPTLTVAECIAEPIDVHGGLTSQERKARVDELLGQVGLDQRYAGRFPHELSGGQRQRVAIARALALHPRLIVCDEPVSALDVSTQAQVINLLKELQDRLGLTYVFVGHDLSVVQHISHRIAVMYMGRVVESGPSHEIYTAPRHPYTQMLLSAVLSIDPRDRRLRSVQRADPAGATSVNGCRFAPRCPRVMDRCRSVDPAPTPTLAGGEVACHLYSEPAA